MYIGSNNLITKHFDVYEDKVILDLPVENEWWLLTYHKHKLIEKLKWNFVNFASVKGMTGESIQGTYQGLKS